MRKTVVRGSKTRGILQDQKTLFAGSDQQRSTGWFATTVREIRAVCRTCSAHQGRRRLARDLGNDLNPPAAGQHGFATHDIFGPVVAAFDQDIRLDPLDQVRRSVL